MVRRPGLLGMVLGPGGTYDSSPAIYRRVVRKHMNPPPGGTPGYRRSCPSRVSVFAKLNRFSHEISIVPPGREQILNTNNGDKSPAYFLVVPPEHAATAIGLNAEMCNRDRSTFFIFAPFGCDPSHIRVDLQEPLKFQPSSNVEYLDVTLTEAESTFLARGH
jgi:hypothetical protein